MRKATTVNALDSGTIVIAFAVAGLLAIAVTVLYVRLHPQTRVAEAHYDQVFKYCTQMFDPARAAAETRTDPQTEALAALPPGAYDTGDDGSLYIFGAGMFEIRLPSQLRLVRDMGRDMPATSASNEPGVVIGCTPQQMARALSVYGLRPIARQ